MEAPDHSYDEGIDFHNQLRCRSTECLGVEESTPCCGHSGRSEHSGHSSKDSNSKDGGIVSFNGASLDVEKGPPIVEHVVISVQGMTCSGCERQLERSLQGTPEVLGNIKISLVLSRAEFDLDVGRLSIGELLSRLHKQTSYKYHQIFEQADGQVLDVVPPRDEDYSISQKPFPNGVTDISATPEGYLRISFDAHIVGARTLAEQSFGHELALAPPNQDPSIVAGKKQVKKEGLLFCGAAMLTIPVLIMAWAPLPEDKSQSLAYNCTSFALATIIQCGVAWEFYPKAFRDLFYSRIVELALLIALSTSAAYIYSVVAFAHYLSGHPLKTGEFFETSTLLITLIMLGRFISEYSRQRATESVSIRSLQESSALLISEEDPRHTQSIDSRLLQYGDLFRVPPDSRITTDGIVTFGGSEVDESMVTGESRLVAKGVGSRVIAGSINRSGALDVKLTKLPSENTIHEIATLVDRGELEKPRTQEIADAIAGWFVPLVVVITLVVFLVQFLVRVYVEKVSRGEAAANALTFAIATLVVSCPCAIGLAVPMVVVITRGVAAKMGVVFKDPLAIENARNMKHIVFDKTGTLTEENMSVVAEHLLNAKTKEAEKDGPTCPDACCEPATNESKPESKDELAAAAPKSLLLGLIEGSKHPVSQAVATHLRSHGVLPAHIHNIVSVPGKGIEGEYQGKPVLAGNPAWFSADKHPDVLTIHQQRLSVLCFSINGTIAAVYGLENPLRREAPEVIRAFQKRGVTVHIVSGDNSATVLDVAGRLGILSQYVKAQASPAAKQEYLRDLLSSGAQAKRRRNGTSKGGPIVVFCGDGTNDAPALRLASIASTTPRTLSASTSLNSEVASAAADVVLVHPDLRGLLILQDVSASAWWRIVLNFVWAGLYNVVALLGAAGAFEKVRGGKGWRIPPAFAAVGELVSVLPVVAVAVTLRWRWRRGRWGQ
ncbi:heavy metal translocatin [Eremomyces bilateralis CBS 781.70]|uniref:Heavy metal translocatin n=1 Tax=Eremomyces bilateralis CBS 781.70 TaxID=1392243 RepID=A0A6G1FRW7_9PEZI|nr:heavy metal translocatin [Eremomyces bilateralis CBS 781.70]KAF1808419.1 heavy metal translocatin [Eremomyces bilateralis CBS 781.70]